MNLEIREDLKNHPFYDYTIYPDGYDGVYKEWEHDGYKCIIKVVKVADDVCYPCGYVRVPKTHKIVGKSPIKLERLMNDYYKVHGGITYSDKIDPSTWTTDKTGWWAGFDCVHRGSDYVPGFNPTGFRVWSEEDMVNECNLLADILKDYDAD